MPRTAAANKPPTGEVVERIAVPPCRYLSNPNDEKSPFLRVTDGKGGEVVFALGDVTITLADITVNALVKTLRKMAS